MNSFKKIQVSSLGRVLYSREAATFLMEYALALKTHKLCFDFSNIEFISRSFADQFYKERQQVKHEAISDIIIENAASGVLTMLNTVAQTQHITNREKNEIPVQTITSKKAQTEYFMSM